MACNSAVIFSVNNSTRLDSHAKFTLGGEGAVAHDDGIEGMGAGSTWNDIGGEPHETKCVSDEDCIFFAAMDGAFDMNVVEAPAPTETDIPSE